MVLDYAALLDRMISLAWSGGAIVMDIYNTDFEVQTKDDGSPVTLADERCEKIILAGLAEHAPNIPVLAEESASDGDIDALGARLGKRFFLVDPLDGTREFANRTGEFTVNIALCEDGVPTLGVVYAPVLEKLYAGGPTIGTRLFTSDKDEGRTICVRPIPGDGMIAVASRSHRSPETEALLEAMAVKGFVAAGSSLKFCLLAEGKADIYPRLGRTMEWDTAAGHAVLSGAGGCVVTHPAATPLTYGKKDRGFDNPHFVAHARALENL
ncbi:MAG: 3'(2'),5'-bisphosphate nucleotidase CysQ [Pseudomonadota bacterium]